MSSLTRQDLEKMHTLAKNSEEKEAFGILAKGDCFRVGVGVRIIDTNISVYFIEVIVQFGQQSSEVNFDTLEDVVCLICELKNRGYRIFLQDVGSFLCEYELEPREAIEEWRILEQLTKFPQKC